MTRETPVARCLCDVAVVHAVVRLGHQHIDVAPQQLHGAPAEQLFAGAVDREDQAGMVDEDDGIDRGVHYC